MMARLQVPKRFVLGRMWGLVGGILLASGGEARVQVETQVDRQTITVGDPIIYTLTLIGDPYDQIQIPALGAALEQFAIRDYQEQGPAPDRQGRQVYRATYVITRYETGECQIPPIMIRWTPPGGSPQTITTEPLKIQVRSVYTGDAPDIRGAKPPVPLPKDRRRVVRLAALAAGALGLGGLALGMRRRHREAPQEVIAEPPRPPQEVALEALDRLARSDLGQAERVRELYFELSNIIRRYLESRFGIAAMERPTGLLIPELQALPLAPEVAARIESFLRACDLPKFARYQPPPTETAAHLEWARGIVLQTMVPEGTEGENGREGERRKGRGEG